MTQRGAGHVLQSEVLALQAWNGRDIPNERVPPPRPSEVSFVLEKLRGTIIGSSALRPASGDYNCFGLVFAGRRVNVGTPGAAVAIDELLRWDGYAKVREPQVGDVAAYRDRRGMEIEHVGFVVSADPMMHGGEPQVRIWSMWGGLGEYLHPVRACPYADMDVEYWRLNR